MDPQQQIIVNNPEAFSHWITGIISVISGASAALIGVWFWYVGQRQKIRTSEVLVRSQENTLEISRNASALEQIQSFSKYQSDWYKQRNDEMTAGFLHAKAEMKEDFDNEKREVHRQLDEMRSAMTVVNRNYLAAMEDHAKCKADNIERGAELQALKIQVQQFKTIDMGVDELVSKVVSQLSVKAAEAAHTVTQKAIIAAEKVVEDKRKSDST